MYSEVGCKRPYTYCILIKFAFKEIQESKSIFICVTKTIVRYKLHCEMMSMIVFIPKYNLYLSTSIISIIGKRYVIF